MYATQNTYLKTKLRVYIFIAFQIYFVGVFISVHTIIINILTIVLSMFGEFTPFTPKKFAYFSNII